ncbi:nitroreductase family protein [Pseudactinotalea sp. Z1748]|uniref:nitroreductase family protein n=1 Tax=Pseudactinotalea sp. Z1748 TaxID=3413027 RepID=UPI003C79C989
MTGTDAGTLSVPLPCGPETPLTPLLARRRSVKSFPEAALGIADVGGALRHAASRVTGAAHASARGQYLVAVTAIIGRVRGLAPGAYEYDGAVHRLTMRTAGDHRERLAGATVDAPWLAPCPMLVLLSTHTEHAEGYFAELGGGQGERFAWLEAGLIAQNLYLWASATGHGTVFIGGLDAPAMADAAAPLLPTGHTVLGIMPLGHLAE